MVAGGYANESKIDKHNSSRFSAPWPRALDH